MKQEKGIENILFIKMRNIGDVLLSTPTYAVAKRYFPNASIGVIVNRGTEAMLTGNPSIDRIHIYAREWKDLPLPLRVAQEISFVREIRREHYDVSINLTEGDRGAILTFLSGARVRIGVDSRGKGFFGKRFLYHHAYDNVGAATHFVQKNLELLTPLLGEDAIRRNEHEPLFIDIPEEDRLAVFALLKERGWDALTPIVHLHPTSRWFYKCWVDQAMAQLIDEIQEKLGARVIVTSDAAPKERSKLDAILSHVRSAPIDLGGKLTLKQLGALSALAKLFVGVDTAPMHIAAAVGTPVVALFGPSGSAHWHPWQVSYRVVTAPFSCGGRCPYPERCEPKGLRECMRQIDKGEVFRAAAHFFGAQGTATSVHCVPERRGRR